MFYIIVSAKLECNYDCQAKTNKRLFSGTARGSDYVKITATSKRFAESISGLMAINTSNQRMGYLTGVTLNWEALLLKIGLVLR